MAVVLNFPENPNLNDRYQTGSSATYIWNGTYWIVDAGPVIRNTSAVTASYAFDAVTSSYAVTSSFALNFNPFATASYALQALTASYAISASYEIRLETSSSYAASSSLAVTSSHAVTALSSSYALSSSHALMSDDAISSSYALSSSHAVNADISITASFAHGAVTASYHNGGTATYLHAQKSGTQSVNSGTQTTVTGWSSATTINAGEWNGSTGTFTAIKPGIYKVDFASTFASTVDTENTEYRSTIAVNGSAVATALSVTETTTGTLKDTAFTTAVVQLQVGDTIKPEVFHNAGLARTLSTTTYFTLQELPKKITR